MFIPALFTISQCPGFFVVVHLFTCAYIVWVISPPCPPPPLLPLPSSVSGRSHSALITDFVEEKTYA
jgi:hypothetical protein